MLRWAAISLFICQRRIRSTAAIVFFARGILHPLFRAEFASIGPFRARNGRRHLQRQNDAVLLCASGRAPSRSPRRERRSSSRSFPVARDKSLRAGPPLLARREISATPRDRPKPVASLSAEVLQEDISLFPKLMQDDATASSPPQRRHRARAPLSRHGHRQRVFFSLRADVKIFFSLSLSSSTARRLSSATLRHPFCDFFPLVIKVEDGVIYLFLRHTAKPRCSPPLSSPSSANRCACVLVF